MNCNFRLLQDDKESYYSLTHSFTFISYPKQFRQAHMRARKPPLFGSPIATGIAKSSFLTDTGLVIPGVVARCFEEINKGNKKIKKKKGIAQQANGTNTSSLTVVDLLRFRSEG